VQILENWLELAWWLWALVGSCGSGPGGSSPGKRLRILGKCWPSPVEGSAILRALIAEMASDPDLAERVRSRTAQR
jgi:hypothetical protein